MTKTQVYEEDKKEIFSARIVSFDLQNWNGHIVMVNREQANEYGIKDDDKKWRICSRCITYR